MGIKDWFLGWTATIPFEGVSDESAQAAQVGVQVEPLEMPGDFELLVKGTSYRQDALKKLGLGPRKFMLAPENHREDSNAVMVFGLEGGVPFHIGYLPKDKKTTVCAHELGALLLDQGLAMQINGEIMRGESGLIAQIELPSMDYMTQLKAEYEQA